MITINIGFYFLTTLFFYWLAKEVLEKKVAAGLATVLVITNYALINFGIAYLTDMGGWFFFIATSYLAVRYFKYENKKDYWGVILLAIVGFLFKEYGGLGMITLITLIGLANKIKREKIIEILKAIIIFGLAVGVYYLIFYLKFNYTYWSWYVFNLDYYAFNSSLAETYSLTLIIKVLGWLYSIGWLWLIWRWWEIKNLDKKTKIILGGMLPASLMWLIWPALTQRIAFILVPWLAIVSGWILYRFKSKWMAGGVVLLYILINYNIQTLMEVINIPWLGN